jgi:Staphylococcal nuclease homologue
VFVEEIDSGQRCPQAVTSNTLRAMLETWRDHELQWVLYETNAKQATSALVYGKEVTLQTHGLDEYGRTIEDVILPEDLNLNQELTRGAKKVVG